MRIAALSILLASCAVSGPTCGPEPGDAVVCPDARDDPYCVAPEATECRAAAGPRTPVRCIDEACREVAHSVAWDCVEFDGDPCPAGMVGWCIRRAR